MFLQNGITVWLQVISIVIVFIYRSDYRNCNTLLSLFALTSDTNDKFVSLLVSYAFLGAEEGLYSLELSKNTDPVMEQVDVSLFINKPQMLRLRVTTFPIEYWHWKHTLEKQPFILCSLMYSLIYTHCTLYFYLRGLNDLFICNTHLTTRGYSWRNAATNNSNCWSTQLMVFTHIFEDLLKNFMKSFSQLIEEKFIKLRLVIITRLQQWFVV